MSFICRVVAWAAQQSDNCWFHESYLKLAPACAFETLNLTSQWDDKLQQPSLLCLHERSWAGQRWFMPPFNAFIRTHGCWRFLPVFEAGGWRMSDRWGKCCLFTKCEICSPVLFKLFLWPESLPVLLIFKGTLGTLIATGQTQVKPWEKLLRTPTSMPAMWLSPGCHHREVETAAVHVIAGDSQGCSLETLWSSHWHPKRLVHMLQKQQR